MPDIVQGVSPNTANSGGLNVGQQGGPSAWTQLTFGTSNVVVYLPLPDILEFDSAYGWEGEDFEQIGNIVSKLAGGQIDSIGSAISAAAAGGKAAIQTNLGKYGDLYAKYKSGQTANPFEQIMFRRVSQREFQMTFSLFAKSSGDQQKYMTMLNALYYLAAPSLAADATMFQFPDTCLLSILEGSTKIVRDRQCAIKGINTNLTPDGVYMRYKNGAPPHVKLTLSFIELVIGTKETDNQIFGFGDSQSGDIQPTEAPPSGNPLGTQAPVVSQQGLLPGQVSAPPGTSVDASIQSAKTSINSFPKL